MLLAPDGKSTLRDYSERGMKEYKKATAPITGEAFGAWAGRDITYASMPGGSLIGFDLSKLRVEDYRLMRDHYQANASLAVLSFLQHQSEWHIECENKKIAEFCEAALRDVWTPLNRSLATANWAGYSPLALQWENDLNNNSVVLGKIKDLIPEECIVNWKTVDGWAPPGHTPPKFKIYDGFKQFGSTWPVPVDNSLWFSLLMEHGDYYGRKLLRPAFVSWYFSILVHLFANRYYERFGEPTPIGRASFEEEIELPTGGQVRGNKYMLSVLEQLRNRSVVVLPNDSSDFGNGKREYDYSLEYLESQMRGADFERYLTRLDEEISIGLFTPILLLRTADVGSYNLGVGHMQCVSPSTKILCADLSWCEANSLKVGDRIIAFDEENSFGLGTGCNSRCYRTAEIQVNVSGHKYMYRVETNNGVPLEASTDHPWLVWRRRSGKNFVDRNFGLQWIETKDLKVGDQVAYFAEPWSDAGNIRDIAWLSGIFDGEGSLTVKKTNNSGIEGRGIVLSVAQNEGPVLDRIKYILDYLGVSYRDTLVDVVNRHHRLDINGGFKGAIRLIGILQPTRQKFYDPCIWEGRGVRRNQSYNLVTVIAIEDLGLGEVASIQTSTGTFITNGYLTHNTYLWMLNAMNNDRAQYIDKYILARLADYNFSPNSPRPKIKFRKLGNQNAELLRALVTELTRSGSIKPDIRELGEMAGMSFQEIEQTVTEPTEEDPDSDSDSDDPEVDKRIGRPERAKSDGPKGTDKPRSTAVEISARVAPQIKNALASKTFGSGLKINMGYKKRMAEALESESLADELYNRMDSWLEDVIAIQPKNSDEFMNYFNKVLESEIERSVS